MIYGINIILVFISQGFDTSDGPVACNKLIETLDFTISNLLAFRMQIRNTSIDLRRISVDWKGLR